MIDNPLTYILIRRNVINEYGIRELIDFIKSSPSSDLSVFDPERSNQSNDIKWKVDKEVRNTQYTNLGYLKPKLTDLFENIVHHIINPFYGIEIYQSEYPQLLSYGVGGHYKPHVDGESLWTSPNGNLMWKKSIDRDLSIVLYLNDDFEGGDFIFPDLNIRIRPEPGMMICFPSNHHYRHGVDPVTKGNRYSIVCWATVKGFETMEEQNRKLSQKYGISINN
jgi:predicted 2-oxoglutarate/Fe(II)-dependent dioxygenase YbiX